jgi:hypothetical protein
MLKIKMELVFLHSDLLGLIFNKLDISADFCISLTCKKFYSTLQNNQWPRSRGIYITMIIDDAARYGYFDLIKYFIVKFPLKYFTKHTFWKACTSGNLFLVQYLFSQKIPWDEYSCIRAAEYGHLHILHWLRSEGCPWSTKVCAGAATFRDISILQWLRSEGCPWDNDCYYQATINNRLDTLKWLKKEKCPCTNSTIPLCTVAAERGNIGLLRWLRIQEPPYSTWNESTCQAAFNRQTHKTLKWLRSQNPPCPWNEEIRLKALELGIV